MLGGRRVGTDCDVTVAGYDVIRGECPEPLGRSWRYSRSAAGGAAGGGGKNRPNTCYAFVETVGTLVIIAVTDVYLAKVTGFCRKNPGFCVLCTLDSGYSVTRA